MTYKTVKPLFFSVLALMLLLGCKDAFHSPDDPIVPDGRSYTVTFNANGGSGSAPASVRGESGESITLPNAGGLSRSNYTFGGWNTNTSGTGTTYTAGSSFTVPNQDVTLYAKWDAVVEPSTPSTPPSNEPGSSSSNALRLPLNDFAVYSFSQDLDAMWFTFSRNSPGCVSGWDRNSVFHISLTGRISVEVYDSGLSRMSISNDSSDGVHLYSSSWAGTYYVKVMASRSEGTFALGHFDH